MSHLVSSWAWAVKLDDPSTKLLLVKLADSANDDGICWPSQTTLGEHCGLSERSIRYKLETLRKSGLVEVVRNRRADGTLAGNVYQLLHRQPASSATGSPLPVTSGSPLPVKNRNYESSSEPVAPTQVDAVWEALIALFGEPANDNERGKRNKAVKLIKQSLNGGFVGDEIRTAEIGRRAARYAVVLPDTLFTDMALANQWSALSTENLPGSVNAPSAIRAMQERERHEREAQEALALPPEESREALRALMEKLDRAVKEVEA